jgi:hypothetical protein
MVDRKVVPFDEFYYQLKLMYLFLLHVVYKNESPFVSLAKTQKRLDRFEYLFFLLFALIQGWFKKKKKIGKVARKIGKFGKN